MEGCHKRHHGRGYCKSHWRRLFQSKEKQREAYRQYVKRNVDKVKNYRKTYSMGIKGVLYNKYKASMDKSKKAHAERYPERERARALARRHIPREQCEISGCTELGERHHEDYNKPLHVRFLCKEHHSEIPYSKNTEIKCQD